MDKLKPMTGTTPTKVTNGEQTVAEVAANKETELEEPYVDKREVTIAPVQVFSAYRNANKASIGPRKTVIGSSIRSSRVLSSNKGEVEAYFPELIGISPSNQDFTTHVKAYLNNISFNVNERGSVLNISFCYDHKKDYLNIKKKEDEINAKRDAAPRNNIKALKEALDEWVTQTNELESTKYRYGRPENIEQYLIYRHCLLYKDVAKDIALINSDVSLRFYIRDENKEAERAKRLIDERKKAMRNFLSMEASDKKVEAVYIQMIVSTGGSVGEAMMKSKDAKTSAIMSYLNDNPDKFNAIYNDKNVEMKAFIEALIARGELVRPEFNQQISTADGTFIGSNIGEAVAYLNNPNNGSVLETLKNKFKLL
jgi:hypothetical protein